MPIGERFSLYLPHHVSRRLREIAEDRGIGLNETMRLSFGILDAMEQARKDGEFVGSTDEREKLKTLFVAPL